ncbi:hypothetical protein M6D93_10560 [Jatrophihabitans telluris]|uniref:DNA-(apurinic or apyrimidinic site) lyase n=1 Tax=Jatrophihabitans telluris TaxID=2038343 RepID=A0ABY4QUK3_9ACTN|nr:DNA-formamidopyrimidine glycosylase family protein [Jatrophihabitans telluris]UQX86751.1 hypothetical protein M6D93_10560 [Jatrophihabitans telluris]
MPEGDTVFITAARLSQALSGRTVTTFDLRVPQLALADRRGEQVSEVVSVGKHLLMRFSGGTSLHSHLRMDGAWRVGNAGAKARARSFEIRALVGNDRFLATGSNVHDLALVPTAEEQTVVGHLGPDLLSPNFDLEEAIRRALLEPSRPVGEVLLDQRVVAGIGNVYKCELLFLHRLNPWQAIETVPDVPAVLNDAVRLLRANCGSFHRNTTGWPQPGQQYYVYGRAGRGCRRCRTAIRQAEQGPDAMERVLYFCPQCQGVQPQGG